MVTRTSDSVPASPSCTPLPSSQSATGAASVLAPKAAEKKPATVTPTWTAARKRFGSAISFWTARPRRPCSESARTWDSRSETSAISAPEKMPPINTKTNTMAMFSQMSFTGGALLGSVLRGCGHHAARSAHARLRRAVPGRAPGRVL
jgi:hypothetical protein